MVKYYSIKIMKILISVIKSISLLLLIIFVLQIGGLTCANDIYVIGPSEVQGESLIKAIDIERGGDMSSPTDQLYECQCPCHLSFSQIEPTTIATKWLLEPHFFHITKHSIRSLSREILQPPKILI